MAEKKYKIKEVYYTLQGEGYQSGTAAVFCRFAGCNLWSGLEKDRETAICKFCDTDFWGTDGPNGGKYLREELTAKICSFFPKHDHRLVVFTGGEPALQLDQALVDILHSHNVKVAIETNGTIELCNNIDWICVSPKADTNIVVTKGHELKLVYPQDENEPSAFEDLDFQHFFIQPKDDNNANENVEAAIQFVKNNPKWRLSAQTHKYLQIP